MGSQVSRQFFFEIVRRKVKCRNFKKIQKLPISGSFLPKYEQHWIFRKIRPSQFLDESDQLRASSSITQELKLYQAWSKNNFLETSKLCQLLYDEIKQLPEKFSKKKWSTAPKKNVELTNRRNQRQTNDRDFIGASVYRDLYTMETWPHLIFSIECW